MKSLTWLLKGMLDNISIRCSTDTHRDFITMSRRIEREGMSFLTITLPSFATDLERGLEQGSVSPGMFASFRKHLALPALLRGLTEKIFDPESGELLDVPDRKSVV